MDIATLREELLRTNENAAIFRTEKLENCCVQMIPFEIEAKLN